MPINEKEYNGNLFDQLTLLERIERQVKKVIYRLWRMKLPF